ncbi:hypothetical protein [Stutzerimonas stutzeri]|uniref:Secreted protein n=1 Tax=Stutzerimonas stutzeri TaxID=316 RepID=A0A6I6LW23_STUST|nr:hypothetical protein [Stutzerimonas stutzeri]QGZ32765.1 hypothetical protein GQA94_20860 [Stutzerimonas stutzeri]
MKKYALLAAAALIASPAAFAADQDLCQLNMQEIDDNMSTSQVTLGEPARSEVEELISQARQAQQSGDTETCIAHSTKALQELEGPGSSGSTGTSGTGSGSSN